MKNKALIKEVDAFLAEIIPKCSNMRDLMDEIGKTQKWIIFLTRGLWDDKVETTPKAKETHESVGGGGEGVIYNDFTIWRFLNQGSMDKYYWKPEEPKCPKCGFQGKGIE